MRLKELFDPAQSYLSGDPETEITGIASDSRQVRPGDLFCCIRGMAADGNRFAADACARGAAAILSAQPHPELNVPQITARNDRTAMAEAACSFYHHPSRQMQMIGITGTNGKTTTTYMIKRLAETAGLRVGLIGTICNMIGDEVLHTERTTPESTDLQALLAHMASSGCDLVVMEVSSHALALSRVHGIQFDVGIFSNLTQDHLDFHGTMARYAEAKQMLFAASRVSLINEDDPAAWQMRAAAGGAVRSYGVGPADLQAEEIGMGPEGVRYMLHTPAGRIPIALGIPGRFSVYNSMAAAGAALELGLTPDQITAAFQQMPPVSGRIEPLDTRGQEFSVLLDYAHTPDSLENVLRTVRDFARGDILLVFGCGGNRDAGKRPLMGSIAAQGADRLFVTSDNPRFEDPDAIIADIEAGIPPGTDKTTIENRREAIRAALAQARPGDVVVLAGKGHEDYQEIRGVKYPFDEKLVVQELLDELGF